MIGAFSSNFSIIHIENTPLPKSNTDYGSKYRHCFPFLSSLMRSQPLTVMSHELYVRNDVLKACFVVLVVMFKLTISYITQTCNIVLVFI